MPRAAARTSRAKSTSRRSNTNVITMLTEDHAKVRKMFKQFEKSKDDEDDAAKAALVSEICTESKLHTQIEEECFYPAAREALEEQDLLDEAEVEHATAKELISQLESMQPGDELYDAKVTVLGEYVEHHAKEEEKEMFPKVRKAKLDLDALAEEMSQIRSRAMQ
jgi:hemerythrin superfamily protein